MSHYDDDRPRWGNRRRNQVVLGAVGLAAVLGGGAYVITAQVMEHRNSTTTSDTGALAPMITPASGTPAETPSADASGAASATASASAAPPSATPAPSRSTDVDEQIRKAREKAAKDGYPLQRALTAAPHAESGPISERSEPRPNGGSLRIITAKFDLSGQRELLWAADHGKPVGDARCTQNFHFSNTMKPTIRPNLLLCWRTSADRSVATVMVDQRGKPSTAESVQIIDREWAKLG
jgi:hypothetical protein